MLPTRPEPRNFRDPQNSAPDIRPGTWWRLVAGDHALSSAPAPEHGLLLMVEEARLVDGEIHTIVLHPHPVWKGSRYGASPRLLVEEFLQAFAPEPEGEALRQVELDAVMDRVARISDEMRTPPDPMTLLERQKEEKEEKEKKEEGDAATDSATERATDTTDTDGTRAHAGPLTPYTTGTADIAGSTGATGTAGNTDAPDTTGSAGTPGTAGSTDATDTAATSTAPAGTRVPATLLPSRDIVEAQKAAETRLAAFEAQRGWIEGKTRELRDRMDLVAGYQQEKVNTTLASISEETGRARSLLENVQTMRLFLGEDMAVTPILEGESADPAEPLTFCQRMLYLDEEVFVHELLDGVNADHTRPGDLAALFSRDFGLVERMLPHPRCVVIARVRRERRDFGTGKKDIGELFEMLEQIEADRRIHIFVRDGERLTMISADETTSGAERLFPSRREIDALFRARDGSGPACREITPDNVDYSDARADHDKRALFYKRFLILLWGVHERTDAFGRFLAKGANWLAATTHSERFRFVHDEEDALEDGRPAIGDYIRAANAGLQPGSRVVVRWDLAIQPETAPSICESDKSFERVMKGVDWIENLTDTIAHADGAGVMVRAPCERWSQRSGNRRFNARVAVAWPAPMTPGRPDGLTSREQADGVLCLDRLDLADLDYYLASRKARRDYRRYLHLVNAARTALIADRERGRSLYATLAQDGHDLPGEEAFLPALRAWRRASKWSWPERPAQTKAVVALARHLETPGPARALLGRIGNLVRGGLTARGEIYAVVDSGVETLRDGTPLPWLTRLVHAGPAAKKARRSQRWTWDDRDALDEIRLVEHDANTRALKDRIAPAIHVQTVRMRRKRTITVPGWKTPRGLFDAGNAGALDRIGSGTASMDRLGAFLDDAPGSDLADWLDATFETPRLDRANRATLGRFRAHLGLLTATDEGDLPRAWILGAEAAVPVLAWHLGLEDEVRRRVERLYARPDRIIERIVTSAPGIELTAEPLAHGSTLRATYRPDVWLSFEGEGDVEAIRPKADLPEDQRHLGWKAAIAKRLARADIVERGPILATRRHSEELLATWNGRVNLEAPDGTAALCDRIFGMHPG